MKIIGYGSLMSEKSANSSCSIKNFSYGYIKGYKRIFNKLCYLQSEQKYLDKTVLTIEPNQGNWLLISYFEIKDLDFTEVKKREWDYNDIIVDIYNQEKEWIGNGTVFISKTHSIIDGKKVSIISNSKEPSIFYTNLIIESVKETPYYDTFIDSTFLSNGKDTLRDFLKNNIKI